MQKIKYLCRLKKIRKMKRRLITKAFTAIAVTLTSAFGWAASAQEQTNLHFPCPNVAINERTDHATRYSAQGWDTVVNCHNNGNIVITAEPYIPTQYFTGRYKVEMIPFNPPDPTFYMNYPGYDSQYKKKMDISNDDYFAPSAVNIEFPFYFFGIRKTKFRLGDNGLVTFSDSWPTNHANHYDATDNNKCDWSCPVSLPWPNNTSGAPFDYGTNCMRDAIYGVYQDTELDDDDIPAGSLDGIYYGVITSPDDDHCRVIIATWNRVPLYNSQLAEDKRQTYQIACYEGSNIIEVHIKHRSCTAGTCSGQGLVGIQNATGANQVRGAVGDPNMYVVNGSPAFFTPTGWNGLQCGTTITDHMTVTGPDGRDTTVNVTVNANSMDSIAYRFTPLGESQRTLQWYRIFDDGRDSIPLTMNVGDPNYYYTPLHDKPNLPDYDSVHPTRTQVFIKHLDEPARFVCCLRFANAEGIWYIKYDTISIGIDTVKDLALKSITPQPDTSRRIDICNGQTAALQLHYSGGVDTIQWRVERILGGRRITLPESMYELQDNDRIISIKPDPRYDTLPRNHIDSIRVLGVVYFANQCSNFDTFLVRVYPIFDTINEDGICNGQTYTWAANGQQYTASTTLPVANLHSAPGCDSTVHLHLTVYDVSYNIDHQETCRDFTWRNGRTYTESNWATASADTVRMTNRYGCDSIVQLELVVNPLRARIQSNVDEFTYDNMEALLSDISIGSNGRVWFLPIGKDTNGDTIMRESREVSVYYTIPDSISEANIWLIAESPYGCLDTAHIYLPMHKETMYVPNAFMPDNPEGNNIFRSQSLNTVMQEMWVYDRQGRVVAHCTGVDCGWDGRDLNGKPCQQGSYVYIINYTTTNNPRQTQSAHGTVTLIR